MSPRTLRLLLPVLALLAACGSNTSAAKGSAEFSFTLPSTAARVADVTKVVVTVQGGPLQTPVVKSLTQLSGSPGTWSGTIKDLPPTTTAQPLETFSAVASDASGNVLYSGSATSAIVANVGAAVLIYATENAPTPGFTEQAPSVNSISSSSATVNALGIINLSAVVTDNQGISFNVLWSAVKKGTTTPTGTLTTPTGLSTNFIAPATSGDVTVTLTATDVNTPPLSTSESFVITVLPTAAGDTVVTTVLNQAPVITRIAASSLRPNAGDTITLTATVNDGNADPTRVYWYDYGGCPGVFSPNASDPTSLALMDGSMVGNSIKFTVNPQQTGAVFCGIWAYVYDYVLPDFATQKGGFGQGYLYFTVGPSVQPQYTPVIDSVYQSTTEAYLGESVQLTVLAHLIGYTGANPQANIDYQNWKTNSGTLSIPGAFNTAIWNPGDCQAGVTPTASVDIIDTRNNLVTTQSFTLRNCAPTSCAGVRANHPEWTLGQGTQQWAIDPDGPGGRPAFSVYCDMGSFDGAWMAVGNFKTSFRKPIGFNLQTQTPFLNTPTNFVSPSPGSTDSGGDEEHYDLRVFNPAYGSTHTFWLQIGSGSTQQNVFFRANAACATANCTPGDAGLDWLKNGVNAHYDVLNFGYWTLYDPNNQSWSVHDFKSWMPMPVPAWTAPQPEVLFGYKAASPAGCTPGKCSCVNAAGATQECYQSAGALIAGQFSGTYADSDMGEPDPTAQNGVPFAFSPSLGAQPIVLWLRDDLPTDIHRQ